MRRDKFNQTSECGAQAPSLACGNTRKSRSSKSHVSAGDGGHEAGKSNCAGRNAKPGGSSVKEIELRETKPYVVAEPLCLRRKAAPKLISQMRRSTTGVQDHKHVQKVRLGNSGALLGVEEGLSEFGRQGVMTESKTNLSRETRCLRTNWEVG